MLPLAFSCAATQYGAQSPPMFPYTFEQENEGGGIGALVQTSHLKPLNAMIALSKDGITQFCT